MTSFWFHSWTLSRWCSLVPKPMQMKGLHAACMEYSHKHVKNMCKQKYYSDGLALEFLVFFTSLLQSFPQTWCCKYWFTYEHVKMGMEEGPCKHLSSAYNIFAFLICSNFTWPSNKRKRPSKNQRLSSIYSDSNRTDHSKTSPTAEQWNTSCNISSKIKEWSHSISCWNLHLWQHSSHNNQSSNSSTHKKSYTQQPS